MRIVRAFIPLALAAVLVGAAGPSMAASFLDRLFGVERPPPPEELPVPKGDVGVNAPVPGKPAPPKKKRPAAPAEPSYPTADIAPKNPDAKKVLVVGDFIASGLAWGLDQAFAEEPRVAILDRSDGPSGFVRDDYADWSAKIPDILAKDQPDMVVVEVGANDRQVMKTADGKLPPRSDAWNAAYQKRIERFLLAVQAYGKPVYWVGATPQRSTDASADMIFLNTLYKAKTEAVGGTFIDVWDGFVDDAGNFVSRGPDMDGQTRLLRASDGINFSKAGRRKLAFYAERSIREDSGLGLSASPTALTNPNSVLEIGPDGKERRVGPVVSLTDPVPGPGSTQLAGDPKATPAVVKDSPQYRLTVEGQPAAAQPGRVDDFAWKPPLADDGVPEAPKKSVVDGIVILPAPAKGE